MTTATAPTQAVLTAGDRCDRCGAQAFVRAVLAAGEPEIPGAGTGLVGLAERATLSGGSLVHGLDEAGNFQLRAWLPWPK